MSVTIAHCDRCGAEAIVKPDQTFQAPCTCALRDLVSPWSVKEYVHASQPQEVVTAAVAVVEAWDQWIGYLSTAKIRIFGYDRILAAVEKLRAEVRP